MILSTNEQKEKSFYSKDILKKCKQFVLEHDMNTLDCGRYDIYGKDFFVNIVNYHTKNESECMWEAHKQYLDIHYIISGTEKIKIANVDKMNLDQYFEESDYLKLDGTATGEIDLNEGDYLILFFEDAHMTGISVDETTSVKKAIFKVSKDMIED